MSPKNSSLAYDELKEVEILEERDFSPELNLIITKRQSIQCDVTLIKGSITVSF